MGRVRSLLTKHGTVTYVTVKCYGCGREVKRAKTWNVFAVRNAEHVSPDTICQPSHWILDDHDRTGGGVFCAECRADPPGVPSVDGFRLAAIERAALLVALFGTVALLWFLAGALDASGGHVLAGVAGVVAGVGLVAAIVVASGWRWLLLVLRRRVGRPSRRGTSREGSR